MSKVVNEVGNRYGRLTVLSFVGVDRHRKSLWLCECQCGNKTVVIGQNLRRGNSNSCGCLRGEQVSAKNVKGDKHPAWKGGRYITARGYVRLVSHEHPRADKHGHVYEHIVVMEKKLNGALRSREVVHHINGNKSDNNPQNLTVMATEEHAKLHITDRPRDKHGRCVSNGNR